MKKIIINSISIYQTIISVILKNLLGVNKFCRFSPTCSEYAKKEINKKGVVKGLALSFLRISRCHPFQVRFNR